MDGAIERVSPRIPVVPARGDDERRRHGHGAFRIDRRISPAEAEREPESAESAEELPLGHAEDDETGGRVDVTA